MKLKIDDYELELTAQEYLEIKNDLSKKQKNPLRHLYKEPQTEIPVKIITKKRKYKKNRKSRKYNAGSVWSKEDVEYIKANMHIDNGVLAKRLRRSRQAIASRKWEIRVGRDRR